MDCTTNIKSYEEIYDQIPGMKEILGEEIVSEILSDPEWFNELISLVNISEENRKCFINDIKNIKSDNADDGLFSSFFNRLSQYAFLKLKIDNKIGCSDEVLKKIACQVIEENKWLCIRCLIVELNERETKSKLYGEDNKARYIDFVERCLKTDSFIEFFFDKYSVLLDLLMVRIDKTVSYIQSILFKLSKDKTKLVPVLCNGCDFKDVVDMYINLSDEHKLGETVAKITLDNGFTIYYKPHGLNNAVFYYKLCESLESCMEVDIYKTKILDFESYSWELEVPHKACKSEIDLEKFYYNIGVHLCLSYLLNVSDLHMENIIAYGKYPVIVDFEVMPNYAVKSSVNTIELNSYLNDTVFNTGLLPINITNIGTYVNGLGGNEKSKTNYKLPAVKNIGTSEMYISYEYATIKCQKNIPVFLGKKYNYETFVSNIISGFKQTYEVVLENKDLFIRIITESAWLTTVKSRYLLRNTQDYFMYQKSSNFPVLMQNKTARLAMLFTLGRGFMTCNLDRKRILKYEIWCEYWGIYPIYHAQGCDLILGNGEKLKNFFGKNAKELLVGRLSLLSKMDLNFQCKVMEINFIRELKKTSSHKNDLKDGKNYENNLPKTIANILLNEVVEYKKEIGWLNIGYEKNGNTYPEFTNLYFYNGISGIAIFFKTMTLFYNEKKYDCVANQLINKLVKHTGLFGKMETSEVNNQAVPMGLYTGEMSVAYTYLILYRITKDLLYLNYAKQHADVVLKHIYVKNDCEEKIYIKNPDYLDGKSGIGVLLVELYKECNCVKYLDYATYLANQLIRDAAVISDKEIGWIVNEQKIPLASLAHGNSGIILFFAKLWTVTEDVAYIEIIKKAIAYEDSLYSEKIMNWLDVRCCGKLSKGGDKIAWCHGSGGILAVRAYIHKELNLKMDWIKYQNAFDKLCNNESEHMCMCHGTLGNDALVRYIKSNAGDVLKGNENKEREIRLSLEDRLNTGFMLGLSGIGYALLKAERPELPEIVIC